MNLRLEWLVLDCVDADTLAAFWSNLLGAKVRHRRGPYVVLERSPATGVRLLFQEVTEPKAGKNRVHPDLVADDLAEAVRRIVELGGRRVEGYERGGFLVMADPEGNEFCVVPSAGFTVDEHGTAQYEKPDA